MSVRLINRHGLLSLPFFFVMNIIVSVAVVLLNYITPIAALILAFGYTWYLTIQTRLMFYFLLLLIAGGTIIATQTPDVTHSQVWLATGFLFVYSAISHGIAIAITKLTGI